jgi:hypothetical protein
MPENDTITPIDPPVKLPITAFYGLLTDPVGAYGKAQYGASTAFTLRGDAEFLRKAQNLFDSFGGETENGPPDDRRLEYRPISFRRGNDTNCLFFCMPPARYLKALTLYFRGQLVHYKGVWKVHRDKDGEYLGQDLLNEPQLEGEAESLAQSFYHHEISLDYRAIPEYVSTVGLSEHCCHGVVVND